MKSRYLHLASLLLLFVASSCAKDWRNDSPNDKPDQNSEIILRIQTPSSFSSSTTRGLTLTQEGEIDNIWVLAFDNTNTLVDIRKGENISAAPSAGDPNIRSFTIKLKRSEDDSDTYSLVTLANCDDILNSTIGTDIEAVAGGLSYVDITTRLRNSINSKMYQNGGIIPMWGETPQMILEKNGSSIDLKIMRAIARVDVGVGARMFNDGVYSWSGKNDSGEIIPFEMTDVYVISPNNAYAVVPFSRNLDADKSKVTKPTVSAGTQAFTLTESQDKFRFTDTNGEITRSGVSTDATNSWGSYTTQSIYIPEADVKMGENARSGDANHENRMAIVIGGKYGNTQKVTYYRLDFAREGNIMDVLRNHLYQFNIKKVSGEGYNDVETAYRSMATNMAVEVLDWNDADISDVVFDGQYYFSITSRKVEFTPMGDETQTLRMKTNVDNFEMFSNTADEVGLKAMSKTTYKHEEMGYDYTLTKAGTDEYDLVIKSVKHNVSNTIPNRLEDWTIRAGRLSMPLTVDQQYTVLYVSYVNGASATLMPEGTAGTVKIPIHIMALVPVQIETEGDDNGTWINLGDISGLSTAKGGLYQARIDVTVPTCPLLADGKKTRQGIIRVTPQGEDPRVFNITQESPYLSFIKDKEYIPRKNGTTYTSFVEVNTNIRKSDLEIIRENSQGANEDRIQIGSDFYNVDATRERFVRFDVKTDMTTPLQLTESSADFKVKIKDGSGYGTFTPPVIKCVIERGSLKFNWYWRWASINGSDDYRFLSLDDETITYIYPWQTTNVTFDLTSNIGGEFDAANSKNKLGAGTIKAETASTDTDGNSVTPYVFTFNNANYNSKGEYTIFFKGDPLLNENKEYIKDIFFRQGVQMWSRTVLPNNGNVGKDGYALDATTNKIDITGNVEWDAAIGGWSPSGETSWIKLKEGDAGAWTTPSADTPLKVDSRVAAPQEHAGTYPLESVLTQKTPLYVAVEPYNTLNMTPESRSAKITFTNRSLDATKGGASIAAPTVNITQYAPILSYVSDGLPATIPGSGGTYNVVARTNLQGWGVKVYSDDGSAIATKEFGTATPIAAHQAAENRELAFPVPANPTAANRQFSFWLYSKEFPGSLNEIKFAERQQIVALEMGIATTSRDYTAGVVSQIVITDLGNSGWKLSTSSDWLQTSTSTGGSISTTERSGIGNNTSWYVYVTKNSGAERKGTIDLKTQDGSIVKSIEIIQTETPTQFTYYQKNVLSAQGLGSTIEMSLGRGATLSVDNGFGISNIKNHTNRSSIGLGPGYHVFNITRYEDFGNGDQMGTIKLTDSNTGKVIDTRTIKHHTCVAHQTIERNTTTYFDSHTDPGSKVTVVGNNVFNFSGYKWGTRPSGDVNRGRLTVTYDQVVHFVTFLDAIPYCTFHCPLNDRGPIATLPAK